LKLFAATVDAENLEGALDLVDRLHLEKSFNLAIRLADHHRKLADLIEDAKDRRFAPEEEEDSPEDTTFMDRLAPSRQISPDASLGIKIKRSMGHQQENLIAKKHRLG
jgi:chromosome transmission fidelity protein 4